MTNSILPAGLEHLAISTAEKKPAKNGLDQAEFLNLILKQIENQDPLNPMEGSEFTSQLAQIATVNGIENLQASFNQFSSNMQSSQALQASTLVGRSVMVEGNVFKLGQENNTQGVAVLDAASNSLTISINDASGQLVREINLGQQDGGFVNFTWDGKDNSGNELPGGVYTFNAVANIEGEEVAQPTTIIAGVESVTLSNSAGGTLVNLHGLGAISLNEVIEIM